MRYLIVRTDFLGDTVLSSTFIKMLLQMPNTTIDSLSYKYNYLALKHNPNLVNKFFINKDATSPEDIQYNQQIYQILKSIKYDAVFMLNRDRKSYKLLKFINSQWVFGHRLGKKSFRSLMFCLISELNPKFNYILYDNNTHEVNNLYNLLTYGMKKLNIQHNVTLEQYCYFYTDKFNPESSKINKNSSTIVLNISGRLETFKYIPTSLARSIIEDLIKLNKQVLLIATPNDLERTEILLKELNNPNYVTLCYENDLITLANTMSVYKTFIGADGGLLHIAAGLHMHCVGLFHAQNIKAWRPWTPKQICLQTTSKRIYDLTSSEVIHAIRNLDEANV